MAVHLAGGISHQRNSGYRPSGVNIMARGLSTPDPFLSPAHLSIRRGRATTTHYTHHQISLMVSHNESFPWGCALGQPVMQASALACEGSVCHPKEKERERKKDRHSNDADGSERVYMSVSNVFIVSVRPTFSPAW